VPPSPAPLDLYIMFDQSLSMNCTIDDPNDANATRWTTVKAALENVLNSPSSAGLSAGIGYFGNFGILSSCSAADYETPDVEIAPLPGNATAIGMSLDNHMPATNTTTLPALTGAINHAENWKTSHPGDVVAVVLVTDGEPNACSNAGQFISDVATEAAAGFSAGIPTFVVGVTSPGTACNVDPDPPNQADLDAVAQAGGTMQSYIVDVTGNAVQEFQDGVDKIKASTVFGCQYSIPTTSTGTLNVNNLGVEYTPASGQPSPIPKVSDKSACTPAAGGWYFDNPSSPNSILLCDSTCTALNSGGGGKVEVLVGCSNTG
jgi:hypothetical protein